MLVKHRIRFSLVALLALSIVTLSLMPGAAAAQNDSSTAAVLQAAIAGLQRSEANKARDQYRHPLQTLTFFGIKPDMTVVEIWPGNGWYTEILAPFLKDHGKLYEAVGEGADAKALKKSSRLIQRFMVK